MPYLICLHNLLCATLNTSRDVFILTHAPPPPPPHPLRRRDIYTSLVRYQCRIEKLGKFLFPLSLDSTDNCKVLVYCLHMHMIHWSLWGPYVCFTTTSLEYILSIYCWDYVNLSIANLLQKLFSKRSNNCYRLLLLAHWLTVSSRRVRCLYVASSFLFWWAVK